MTPSRPLTYTRSQGNRGLDIARTFQFPTLRQPPPSFLATMEEYIKEAPQIGAVSNKRLEYEEKVEEPQTTKEVLKEPEEQPEVAENKEELIDTEPQGPQPEAEEVVEQPKSSNEVVDLLGLNEVNPQVAELEESNALALAIIQPGKEPQSGSNALMDIGKSSGWELALVTAPSTNTTNQPPETKMAGGFDKLLLDSLYEDDAARRQLMLTNAGYNAGYGYDSMALQTPFDQHDPFALSNSIPPPTNVQMAQMAQQQQQQNTMMVPYGFSGQYPQQQMPTMGSSNPFGDPFDYPHSTLPPQHGNNTLI